MPFSGSALPCEIIIAKKRERERDWQGWNSIQMGRRPTLSLQCKMDGKIPYRLYALLASGEHWLSIWPRPEKKDPRIEALLCLLFPSWWTLRIPKLFACQLLHHRVFVLYFFLITLSTPTNYSASLCPPHGIVVISSQTNRLSPAVAIFARIIIIAVLKHICAQRISLNNWEKSIILEFFLVAQNSAALITLSHGWPNNGTRELHPGYNDWSKWAWRNCLPTVPPSWWPH